MGNRYVIPDIHGCYVTLRHMINSVLKPDSGDQLIFLGDYINKGPDSKAVLDYLMDLMSGDLQVMAVMGNHDKMLLDLQEGRIGSEEFENKGGDQTFRSFDATSFRDIPQKYFKFIEGLSPYLVLGEDVIVHAGINFMAENPWRDFDFMLTVRDYQVEKEQTKFRRIIHGHQASSLADVLERVLDENATTLNLDNGCVYTTREGMGNLFVLNLKDMSFHVLPCLD